MTEEQKNEDLKQNKDDQSSDPQGGQEGDLKQETDQPNDPGADDANFYKQELEKIKQERDNYKQGLLSKKEEIKKIKDEHPDVSKEDIEEIVNQRVQEEAQKIKSDLTKEQFNDALSGLTNDPDKQELIKYHYENSINKTGSVKTDLNRALLLADEKRILNEREEFKKSLSADSSITNTSQGSSFKSQKEDVGTKVKLDPASKALLDRTNAQRRARGEKELSPEDIINQ
jgi:hypothetical protein